MRTQDNTIMSKEEREIRQKIREETQREREKEELIDAAWELFCSIEDNPNVCTVKAAKYFINTHGFDIEMLPREVKEAVEEELRIDAMESYYSSEAEMRLDQDYMRAMNRIF